MGLEHYGRVRKLGKGSFGEVYLVRDLRNGQQYVMKEVDISQFGAKGRREALKEVAFLAAMHHPNIVAYREFFEAEAQLGRKMLFLVMDYADGGDVDSRIKAQNGRLFSESQILEWFVQICLAVKHIHDRKIIHRDIKAENLFLIKGAHGQPSRVVLGDFGISKSMAHTMANAVTRIGTPYYLSPEICMNKAYNSKSDMWSLGVVLYELMTLKHPFDATSMEGLLNKIVKSQPGPLPKHYSIELRTVVDALLSKQPSKRPTVNALLKLPFLAQYVANHLSPAQIADEFSHTVIHSEASARGAPVGLPLPPSNQVQVRERAPPGIRAKPVQPPQQHPSHAHVLPAVPALPPARAPVYHVQEEKESGRGVATPYSDRAPSAHRNRVPSARGAGPAPSPSAVPPSPYAGMSNAEAIRAIRLKKEAELREARAMQQLDAQRRREAAELAEQADRERADRAQQLAREQAKERALIAAANGNGVPDYALPPALRQAPLPQAAAAGPARGIPAVRRPDASAAATPLHGVPYRDDRGPVAAAGGPTRLAQHQLLAEEARRHRDEEMQKMRLAYFHARKTKREAKLAQQQQQQPHIYQQQGGYPAARAVPPPIYPPPRPIPLPSSRPPSSHRYGPSSAYRPPPGVAYMARRAPPPPIQQPPRWR